MTTVARGPYRAGIEKRRRIVEKAIAVFGEHGYGGGSLRMVAERVGASASQIIALFGSKDGLLTAVLNEWDARQVDDGRFAGIAHIEALRARMRYSREHPEYVEFFATLCAEATALSHPAHQYFIDRYERVADALEQHLRLAAETGEIAPLADPLYREEARALSAMMDGLQLQWLMNRRFDMVAAFDRFLDAAIARWQAPASPAPGRHHETGKER